jgi:hypothetical protein
MGECSRSTLDSRPSTRSKGERMPQCTSIASECMLLANHCQPCAGRGSCSPAVAGQPLAVVCPVWLAVVCQSGQRWPWQGVAWVLVGRGRRLSAMIGYGELWPLA